MHFLLNSTSIIALLMAVEPKFTAKVFGTVFLIGGIQGNLLSCLAHSSNDQLTVAVGASTSICAILGLYMSHLYLSNLHSHENISKAKKTIIIILIYLFIISMVPGVDFYGHFGSLISGALIGLIFPNIQSHPFTKIKIISALLFIIYSLSLLSFFI